MSIPVSHARVTAEQFVAIPDNDRRCELVNGDVRVMSLAGSEHGRGAFELALRAAGCISAHRLGSA